MENLEFLPERILLARRRRRRQLTQVVVAILCVGGLFALGYLRQGGISRAQAELDVAHQQNQKVQQQLTLRGELERQLGELQVLKRIDEQLGSRISALDVLAELDKLLPQNMAMTKMSLEAVQYQVAIKPPSGEGSSARAKPMGRDGDRTATVKRIRLLLTGVAPGDLDVANFIGQLSASPLFEDVNMGYTKSIEFKGRLAREFQASCYIAP